MNNLSILNQYICSSPSRNHEENYNRLKKLVCDGIDDGVSQELEGILELGFFRRVTVIILTFLCLRFSVAEIIREVASEYFYQLNTGRYLKGIPQVLHGIEDGRKFLNPLKII